MKKRITIILAICALTMTGCEKIHQLAFDVDKDVAIHINEYGEQRIVELIKHKIL